MPSTSYAASVTTSASPEAVWRVWSDLVSWPTWTKSISSVDPLEDALPLHVGYLDLETDGLRRRAEGLPPE